MRTFQSINCTPAKVQIRQRFFIIFCIFVTCILCQLTACSSGNPATIGEMTVLSMTPSQIYTTGGQVAFAGTNFTSDVTVTFGGVAATKVYLQNSTLITAVSPAVSAPSTVDVVVTNSHGSVTLSKALSYVTPPVVTPSSCNSLPCTYKAYDPANTLVGGAQVATCSGCPDGEKVGNLGYGAFVIINNVYAPKAGNYTLTITGCEGGGTEDYQVIVDGGAAVSVPLSGSNWNAPAPPITITVPLQAGSNNTVELGNASAYSPDVVNIQISSLVSNPITVTNVTPTQLLQSGGPVTFTGTNFTPDITATFGGAAATSINYTSSTQFSAVAPAAATAGPVNVVVSSASGGSVTLNNAVTYVAACSTLPCTYLATSSINTLVGGAQIASCTGCPGGQKVGNLGYGADVIYNGIYAPANGNYTISLVACEGGGTQDYQVITDGGAPVSLPITGSDWNNPAAPVTMNVYLKAGQSNTIEVGNANGYSPDAVSVTINTATSGTTPTITSLAPNTAPITGGSVTITGTNFEQGASIMFGGVPAQNVTYVSPTQITATVPGSSTVGAVDVTVDTPSDGDFTDPKAFTYTEIAPCTNSTCVYQAWDPANTIKGGGVASCIGCANGLKVGSLGNGSTVTINNVYAPADGNYILSAVACEGGGNQTLQAVVNGGTAINLPFTGNNWYVPTPPEATIIPLKKGSSNTIQLGNSTNYSPDVVYVVVSPANQPTTTPTPNTVVMTSGANTVTYDLASGLASYSYNGATTIASFYAQAYSGNTLYQSTSTSYTRTANTNLPSGETDITLTATDGSPKLIQRFFLSTNHFTTQLEMDGVGLSSNEMSPLVVNSTGAVDLGAAVDSSSSTDTVFLQVPFDNDGFVPYNAASSNGLATTGAEVAAFYDNTSRNGLVIGSVTHNNWKTGISMSGSNNKLDMLMAFGGANDPWDSLPHAAVNASTTTNNILSPTILVGYYSDWRAGMEDFGTANSAVTPMLPWTGPAPMGWGALGPNETNITEAQSQSVSDYFHTSLPAFNDQGVQYINLDAQWSNFSLTDLQNFVAHVHANGQKAGIYWTPWVVWDFANIAGPLDTPPGASCPAVSAYTNMDVLLKDHYGNPMAAVDAAYGVDPTHPGVKARIDCYTAEFKTLGFDYIKLDFMSHCALEGGSNNGVHYDPTVTTGEQAYNQGMTYLINDLGTSMLMDLSIAPIFPYQYAHARRVSCDTYGAISNTSYEMNSESYGWWMAGRIYNWNDPDMIHVENTDTTGTAYTSYENKSRVISTAVAGYMLSGDNPLDTIAPPLMQTWMTNKAINTFPAMNLKFRPVEGNTGTSPVNVMIAQGTTPNTYYIAVFNYTTSAVAESVNLTRAGLSGTTQYNVTDLWTGATSTATGTLSISLQAAESTIVEVTQ